MSFESCTPLVYPQYSESPSIVSREGLYERPLSPQTADEQWKVVTYLQEQINQLQQHIQDSVLVNSTGTNTTLSSKLLVNAGTNTSFLAPETAICVPLIQYDSGSEDNEDPAIESLTLKYLHDS